MSEGGCLSMLRVLLLCGLAAVGCVRVRELPAPVAAPLPQPAASSVPEPVAALPDRVAAAPTVARELAALLDSGELIVGDRSSLEAWMPDGTSHRTISAGAALHPRRFGHDHVLALRSRGDVDFSEGAVLELISLQNGERRELAELPAFRCAGLSEPSQAKPARLEIREPASFEVDSEKRVACLDLADGAVNTATVRVRVRIDLAAAHVSRWLAFGDADCIAPDGVAVGEPPSDGVCWRMAEAARQLPDPAAYPFTFANEHVRSAAKSGAHKLQVRGYDIESVSPSNRWLLLAGDYTERETTYRRLLLLDRSRGALFPVGDRAGPWPPRLGASGTKLAVPIKQAALVPNTRAVHWLGTKEETELLVSDNLVIKPGGPAFQFADAELAR